jgi:hypothetical protein
MAGTQQSWIATSRRLAQRPRRSSPPTAGRFRPRSGMPVPTGPFWRSTPVPAGRFRPRRSPAPTPRFRIRPQPAAKSRSGGMGGAARIGGIAVVTTVVGVAYRNRDKLTELFRRSGEDGHEAMPPPAPTAGPVPAQDEPTSASAPVPLTPPDGPVPGIDDLGRREP